MTIPLEFSFLYMQLSILYFVHFKIFKAVMMKCFTRFTLLICVCLFSCIASNAQQAGDSTIHPVSVDSTIIADTPQQNLQSNDSTTETKKKSYLSIGLSYLNDNVYLGRKDSAKIPYITPDIAYYFKSGFYIEGSLSYVNSSSQNRIDAVTFSGGYAFTAGNYSGDATASKFFYSSQSTSVKSEVKSSLAYYNSYNFGFITPTVTATLNFGTKTDIAGQFGLEHSFSALKDKLVITPTLAANASTQNYYSNYYKKRKYTIKRKGKAPVPGIANVSGIVENASTFKLLDYEISLPLEYETGKFTFSFTPVYAIPVHPSVVQITTVKENGNSTTRTATEKIANTFFGTIGLVYKFGK